MLSLISRRKRRSRHLRLEASAPSLPTGVSEGGAGGAGKDRGASAGSLLILCGVKKSTRPVCARARSRAMCNDDGDDDDGSCL